LLCLLVANFFLEVEADAEFDLARLLGRNGRAEVRGCHRTAVVVPVPVVQQILDLYEECRCFCASLVVAPTAAATATATTAAAKRATAAAATTATTTVTTAAATAVTTTTVAATGKILG